MSTAKLVATNKVIMVNILLWLNKIGDFKALLKTVGVRAKLTNKLAIIILVLPLLFSSFATAAVDVYEFESPSQEAQYKALIEEFRCPKCQNQNLAGSDSQIAQDLKRKTYEMVIAGQSDQQIREYMQERYGDFISYKPPVRPSTWILWFFPPLILLCLLAWWLWRSSKTNRTRANWNKDRSNQDKHNHDDNTHADAQQPNAKPIDTPLKDNNKSNAINDSIASDLSAQEQQQLDALLKKHPTIASDVDGQQR